MKKNVKLAFDRLEHEMSLIPIEDLLIYRGGNASGSTLMPNGYCVFNAISQMMYGNINSAQFFNDLYNTKFGSSGAQYDASGNILGYNFSQSMIMSLMGSQQNDSVSMYNYTGSGDLTSVLGTGVKVMAVVNSIGPNGETLFHAIQLNSGNSNGVYSYYDPTGGFSGSISSSDIKWSFGWESSLQYP